MSHSIITPITKLLKCDIPIISAPMGGIAMAELAGAVTSSGGFGFIGTGKSPPTVIIWLSSYYTAAFTSSNDIKREIAQTREILNIKAGEPVPIGIGFIGWILDKTEISDDPRIHAVLEEKPAAIWLAFGVELGKYVSQIRAYDAERDHKTLIFVIVNSAEDALKAANDWKVDVLVVQGIEAGGHGGSESPPLMTLLQEVLDILPNGPPVVAAGGISTGAQVAAVLTMGSAGAVLGTRFLFTNESKYSDIKKEVLLHAGHNSTTRSMAFDEVGRTMGWPPKCDGRAISNKIINDLNSGLSLEDRMANFDASAASGDTSRLVVWAGTGVGLCSKLSPTAEVVRSLREEIIHSLRRASTIVR